MTSSWFFLSTLNYDARSTTHQIMDLYKSVFSKLHMQNLCLAILQDTNSLRIRNKLETAYKYFIFS